MMAQGKLQADRKLALTQASLFWRALPDEEAIDLFIRTGYVKFGEDRDEVIPYDPDLLRSLVDQGLL